MEHQIIKEKTIECMNNIGVFIFEDDKNFKIDDYIVDSVMFVSLIMEFEHMFDIDIPDEYLMADQLQTLEDICTMIETLLSAKESCREADIDL
jgi:hypothetical protein